MTFRSATMILAVAAAVLATTLGLSGASSAAGATYRCDGTVGQTGLGSYTASTIAANLDVPAGATCLLYRVTVTGKVTVEGSLSGFGNTFEQSFAVKAGAVSFPACLSLACGTLGRSTVEGEFTAASPQRLTLSSADFKGNVTVDGATGSVDLTYALVGGNLVVSNSTAVMLFDMGSRGTAGIGGNATLVGDTISTVISNVVIGGTLSCAANNPSPRVGPRVTASRAKGQCGPRA